MKSNKYFHFLIILMLLFQTAFPPALLAQIQKTENQPTNTTKRSVDDLFDATVSSREKQLLFEFVQYVISSFAPREGLRKASEDLNTMLQKDQLWESISIDDQDVSDLLVEANAGRRYLIEKGIPLEVRLFEKQRSLEKQLISDHEQISTTGIVPNGFMERARNLAYLYDRQDDLWEMKMALLIKTGMLYNNIVSNFIDLHPEKYSNIQDQLTRTSKELDDIVSFASFHYQKVLALKTQYQNIQNKYDGETVSALSADRQKTLNLINIVRNQTSSLEKQQTPNSQSHAELLEQVTEILDDRIARIDQHIGKFQDTDSFPNPLYVEPGLGESEQSRELADAYRDIVRKLINQTQLKTNGIKTLKTSLADIRRSMGQENIFFQTLINETDSIPAGKKQSITNKSSVIANEFIKNLKTIEDDLEHIIHLTNGFDFEKPDMLMGSQASAAKLFRLNRKIENFITSAGDIDLSSVSVDLKLYALLADMDFNSAHQLESFKTFQKTSIARDEAVKHFSEQIEAIRKIADTDADLAKDLKQLGQDIITRGQAFYNTKTQVLSDLLTQNQSAIYKPYFNYLIGVYGQLQGRLDVIEKMVAFSKETDTPAMGTDPCPDCPKTPAVWLGLAELGTAYSDTLKQMDALDDIESFYTQDKFKPGNLLSDARNVFALNKRLGNQPYLHLNPNSIDVVFRAGDRMIVLKGIGDPKAIDISSLPFEMDHLMQPPYIGFGDWLSSGISSVGNWVKPIGQSVYNTASDVVSSTVEVGGKIATTAGQVAQTTYEGAKNTVKLVYETASDIASTTIDVTGQVVQAVYEDGKKAVNAVYQDGKEAVKTVYEDGKKAFQTVYEDGKQVLQTIYQDGKETVQTLYEDGKEAVKIVYEDGKEAIKTVYEDGKEVGKALYEDAKNAVNAVYNNAKQVGKFIYEEGKIVGQVLYEGGKEALKTGYEALKTGAKIYYETSKKISELTLDWTKNTLSNIFLDDDGSFAWMKVGGYAIGTTLCILSGGVFCAALAVAGAAVGLKGAVDTAAMDKYGIISKNTAGYLKFGIDVAEFIATGLLNIGQAGFKLFDASTKAWQKLNTIQKIGTFLGITAGKLKGIQTLWKADWSKVKNWSLMAVKLAEVAEAYLKIPDLIDKAFSWSTQIDDIVDDSGIDTGIMMDLIKQTNPLLWLLDNHPFAMNDFSVMAGVSPGGGSGAFLPGGGGGGGTWGNSGNTGSGVSLIPGDSTSNKSDKQWVIPTDQASPVKENKYKDWVNPYKDWVNPFKDWVSPW